MSSKIEQIIEEIEEYIDGCKPQTLSKTNIIVNKEEIEELLRELRMKTPEEIKRYQKVLANRDAILADAQAKADAIIKEANIRLLERSARRDGGRPAARILDSAETTPAAAGGPAPG